MLEVRERRLHESKKHHGLLLKWERAQQSEEPIRFTHVEKETIRQHQEMMKRLELVEMRLDQNLMILRDF